MGNRITERVKISACAFIPDKVKTQTVVDAMELMRRHQKRRNKDYSYHLRKNEEAFKAHEEKIQAAGGYIEDQRSYVDIWFGSCTMKFSGCEIIATYNALSHMNVAHPISLAQMIHEFEEDGMLLSGKFGTAPKAIRDFFEKRGFLTRFSTRDLEFDDIAKQSDSLILTIFNDKTDIRKEVHTVHVSKENGEFCVHNLYGNGVVEGPFTSMKELLSKINGGKAKGISLLGISNQN